MTRQLRELLNETDLRRRDYRRMEIAVAQHPVKQIISVINRIDPNGKRQWPSFHNAVAALPEHIISDPSWDYRFWHLYDIFDQWLSDWDTRDMWMIDKMKDRSADVVSVLNSNDALAEVFGRFKTIKQSAEVLHIGERWDG